MLLQSIVNQTIIFSLDFQLKDFLQDFLLNNFRNNSIPNSFLGYLNKVEPLFKEDLHPNKDLPMFCQDNHQNYQQDSNKLHPLMLYCKV